MMGNRIKIGGSRFGDKLAATSRENETLLGRDGDDEFAFFELDFTDKFVGGRGDDTLLVDTLEFESAADYGLTGNIKFAGGKGKDTLSVKFDIRTDKADILELGKFDFSNANTEFVTYRMQLSGADTDSGGVKFIGTRGAETLEVFDISGSGPNDILARLGGGNDVFIASGLNSRWDSLVVNTGAGDDSVYLGQSADGARIITGKGDDTVYTYASTSENIKLGGGNDAVVTALGFNSPADTITTGGGKDSIYVEANSFSTVARVTDFNPARDVIILKSNWKDRVNIDEPETGPFFGVKLVMDNEQGGLFLRDNLVVDFGGPTDLTVENFEFVDTFLL